MASLGVRTIIHQKKDDGNKAGKTIRIQRMLAPGRPERAPQDGPRCAKEAPVVQKPADDRPIADAEALFGPLHGGLDPVQRLPGQRQT